MAASSDSSASLSLMSAAQAELAVASSWMRRTPGPTPRCWPRRSAAIGPRRAVCSGCSAHRCWPRRGWRGSLASASSAPSTCTRTAARPRRGSTTRSGSRRWACRSARSSGSRRRICGCLVAACLLHDIGHYPLSHAAEPGFARALGVAHHGVSEWIVRGNGAIPAAQSLRPALERAGLDPELLWAVIVGDAAPPHAALSSLLLAPINLDTLDGIRRTARSFGRRGLRLPPALFARERRRAGARARGDPRARSLLGAQGPDVRRGHQPPVEHRLRGRAVARRRRALRSGGVRALRRLR
jgi:hypothetical protein